MHFRQYVLKSILIGAALFFPTNAYAEKADHTPKLPIQPKKETVQNKNHAIVNQVKKERVRKPEKTDVKKVDKTLEKKKALPVQASPKAKAARQSIEKKSKQDDLMNTPKKKAAKSYGKKKSIIKKQIKKAPMNKGASKQVIVKRPLHSKEKIQNSEVNENEFVHEIKIQSPIVITKKSMARMSSSYEKLEASRKQNTPNSATSFPKDLVMIFSQESYHSGVSSKDRKITGFNTYSLSDKWFIRWEKYWLLESNQSFIFQNHKISSQWMNAPPFQPPKSFLFS